MESFTIRPADKTDRNWVAHFLDEHWGSTRVVSRGQVYLAHLLPGFIAEQDDERIGLVTYRIDEGECEIVTINSLRSGEGIGTALIEAAKAVAAEEGCKRVWLITTNDNMEALRFYQKRDFPTGGRVPQRARRIAQDQARNSAVRQGRDSAARRDRTGNHALAHPRSHFLTGDFRRVWTTMKL